MLVPVVKGRKGNSGIGNVIGSGSGSGSGDHLVAVTMAVERSQWQWQWQWRGASGSGNGGGSGNIPEAVAGKQKSVSESVKREQKL